MGDCLNSVSMKGAIMKQSLGVPDLDLFVKPNRSFAILQKKLVINTLLVNSSRNERAKSILCLCIAFFFTQR